MKQIRGRNALDWIYDIDLKGLLKWTLGSHLNVRLMGKEPYIYVIMNAIYN